jgi:hypothetical protein
MADSPRSCTAPPRPLVSGPRAREAQTGGVLCPVPPSDPGRAGGDGANSRRLAGLSWWPPTLITAGRVVWACPCWFSRARLRPTSRPWHQEPRPGVGGRGRVLHHGMRSVCGPAWGFAAESRGGRAEHGGATRAPRRCLVPSLLPSLKVFRAGRHLATRALPAQVAAVGTGKAGQPRRSPSPPTRRWRRRATAYIVWQAAGCAVWPAPQLGRSAFHTRWHNLDFCSPNNRVLRYQRRWHHGYGQSATTLAELAYRL